MSPPERADDLSIDGHRWAGLSPEELAAVKSYLAELLKRYPPLTSAQRVAVRRALSSAD